MIVSAPPPEFNFPFPGELIVIEAPALAVDSVCRVLGGTSPLRSIACALPMGDRCTIVIPEITVGIDGKRQGALRRHEEGHCNGWPGDHRGAR